MSSVLRSYAQIAKPPTKFFDILTGSYYEDQIVDDENIPIPFTVTNAVLDINIAQSTDVESFVNNGNSPDTAVIFQGKVLGGATPVSSFGTNMETWLRKRIQNIQGLGSPYDGRLTLYVRPLMVKIQLASQAYGETAMSDEAVYGETTEAPTSTEYIGGSPSNDYLSAWVFKTPMTVQYTTPSGGLAYITMTSQFSAN
jgi:hypothetical protein